MSGEQSTGLALPRGALGLRSAFHGVAVAMALTSFPSPGGGGGAPTETAICPRPKLSE